VEVAKPRVVRLKLSLTKKAAKHFVQFMLSDE